MVRVNGGNKMANVYTAGPIRLGSVIDRDRALSRGPEYSNYMIQYVNVFSVALRGSQVGN